MTLANPRRARLVDHADVARLTAVPDSRTDLVARLATVPGLVRPGIAHRDMKTRLPLHPLSNENASAIHNSCTTSPYQVQPSPVGSARTSDATALGRLGTPQDTATLISFLCSSAAAG
jgi:NAD(P)-dependent dehydrogenase (short-subunit alcohol dehydrogenase family)